MKILGKCLLIKVKEVNEALNYYSADDLIGKLESITGHGFTKPNDKRFPNQPLKSRRVELSLVLILVRKTWPHFQTNRHHICSFSFHGQLFEGRNKVLKLQP